MEFEDIWNIFSKFCLILFIFVCLNSIAGDIFFRMKFSFPHVSETTSTQINIQNDPIQKDLIDAKYFKAYGEKNVYSLQPQAEYSISGLVVAKNNNFWFRDIMRNDFDDLALMDIGLVWGELAQEKKKLYKHWKIKSRKTLGQARQLTFQEKKPYRTSWGINFMVAHMSHTHLIPANLNVMSGLLTIKKNDIVKLDGYLVDIYTSDGETVAKTSMSRTDRDFTSRGSGACEDMYVKQVQIGNKIYK